jgi:predicted ester cyclase
MAVENWAVIDIGELFVQTGVVSMGGETSEAGEMGANGGLTDEVAADFVTRFDAVFNESIDVADELFAEDFVGHLPLAPELTRDGWKAYVESFRASFPDMRQTTHVSVHSGDLLVVRVTYNGTHQADYFGAEPTGNPIAMEGLGIFRFEDGKPVENWAVVDLASVLVQTGVWVPAMPE